MALHHRKLSLFDESYKKYASSCYICYVCPKECYLSPSPSPPPPPSLPPAPLLPQPPDSKNHLMTIILILMLSVLSAAFLFLSYLTIGKYRSRRGGNPETTLRSASFNYESHGPVLDHPIWYIRTVGLPQSTIDSISIVRYGKSLGAIAKNDCSVCLSEFQENEPLRLLPKCSHAFHVPCIDTWLRSHKNCPVCRAPISVDTGSSAISSLVEPRPTEEDQAADEAATDEASAENQLAGILAFELDLKDRKFRGLSDMGDRRVIRLNFESDELVRRSVSMGFPSPLTACGTGNDEGCSDARTEIAKSSSISREEHEGKKIDNEEE